MHDDGYLHVSLAVDLAIGLEVDGLAFVLLQQPILVDDSRIVVLLDNGEVVLAGGIAEDDGVGLELAGDLGGGDFVCTGLECEIDRGAGDGEVLVVDGERDGRGGLLRDCG